MEHDSSEIRSELHEIKNLINKVLRHQSETSREIKIIMATIQDLQTAAQALAADVQTLKAGVEAFIAAHPDNSAELQGVLDSLTSTDADVKTTDSEVTPAP